ncbi:MAG: hypothetical protein AB8G77_24900 [Rhodothermales bacterium]
MDMVYLVSLLVGGFFVLLSIFGGDADVDGDVDIDIDGDFDFDGEAGSDIGAGGGLVDLFSVRALFLFAAFFGLTGKVLTWAGSAPTLTAILAIAMGLVVGLGGNYLIKRVGYAQVSSNVSTHELKGVTGKVLLPFTGSEKGKISLIVKGNEVRLIARSLDDSTQEAFEQGDEIVVVRSENGIAEVVKPT